MLIVGDDRTYNDAIFDPGPAFPYNATSVPWKYSVARTSGFVSLLVSHLGVFKDPVVLHLRLIYHSLNNHLPQVIGSYYLEHLVGLRTLEQHFELLSEVQLEAFDQNCRIFTSHRSLIPGFFLGTRLALFTPLSFFFQPGMRKKFYALRNAFRSQTSNLTLILSNLPGDWSHSSLTQSLAILNLYIGQRPDVPTRDLYSELL